MTSASILVRLQYERIWNLTSEARLPWNRTISESTKQPIPDIFCLYQEHQRLRLNHGVLSDGQTPNSNSQFSNQFIDFTLLLDISPALYVVSRKNIRPWQPWQMSRRNYTYMFLFTNVSQNVVRFFAIENMYKTWPGSSNKRINLVSVIGWLNRLAKLYDRNQRLNGSNNIRSLNLTLPVRSCRGFLWLRS